MKKALLIMFTMGLFATGFTSCRDTKEDPIENAADEVGDEIDQTADEIDEEI